VTGRARDLAKGLAALAGLLLLIIGPPVALASFVGWPLPTTLPGLDTLTGATRRGIDDMVVVKLLAVVAWVCWAQIALAAAVELVAVIRGRAAGRAPVLAGLQLGVGRLVATAALIVASSGLPRIAYVPVPVAQLAVLAAEPSPVTVSPEPPLVLVSRVVEGTRQSARSAGPEQPYVVKRNDSWWALAERTLGSGQRWTTLREANLGRTMPDGTVIALDSELIRPGWQLLLPGDRVDLPPETSNEVAAEVEVAVRAGDNLWAMAERHLEAATNRAAEGTDVRGHWATVVDMNRDRLADPANPSRIYSGQRIRMPSVGPVAAASPAAPPPAAAVTPPTVPSSVPSSVPASPPVPARPDTAPTSTATTRAVPTSVPAQTPPAATRRPRPTSAPTDSASSDHKAVVPVGILGTASTVLAVGVAAAVTRRRRLRQMRLPAGVQPPTPPPELDDLRAAMVVNGDVDQVTRLHRALRDVAVGLGNQRSDARPRIVQVTTTRIEVLLSRAVLPAPKPWRAEASGMSWELKGEPLDRDEDGIAPTPTLVSIGRPDPDTELYLDLEAEGVVSLVGSTDAVADVARSWVLELATSPMASGVSILVVGESRAPAEETSDRVRCVDTWDEVEADALAWCEQSGSLLSATRWATPVVGRMQAERTDDLAPLVIVAEGVPLERLKVLADAILAQQAVVVLVTVGGQVDSGLRVEVSDETMAIPSLGLVCQAQAVPPIVAEQVDELVTDASRLPAQLSLMPEPPRPAPVTIGLATDEYQDPPFEILVRLLGDISVVGAHKNLKPKQVAVLAYIALHAPVACERVQDAVWVTPTASRSKRLANTVSETRGVLGPANLPISVDGRYRVGPGVVTDVDLFDRRLDHAAQQDDVAAAATLRGALELVDGPVFTYRNVDRMSYVWVDLDNWISTWELKVTDTAEELAQRYLDLGDPKGAVWAARRGLSACQTHTRVTQLLMQAHIAGGDRLAAERVMQSYRSVMEKLELDDECDDLAEPICALNPCRVVRRPD